MNFGDVRSSPRSGRGGKTVGIIAFAAAAAVFGWSLFNIIQITAEDAASGRQTQEMQSFVSIGTAYAEGESQQVLSGADAARAQEDVFLSDEGQYITASGEVVLDADNPVIEVDFPGLASVNPDVAGWITIPGTNISHALVKGEDNDWYLHHGPDGSVNRAGSIFIDAGCSPDLSDRNTVVYGHRMNNGTMFAQLHNFEDPAFAASHPYVYITRQGGQTLRYRIFDVSQISYLLSDPAYRMTFTDDADFTAWKSEPAGTPYFYETPGEGNVITLSTCVRGDGARRFVVRAVLDQA